MRRVHLEAAEDHVERLAREGDPVGAIKEIIWNALDADALTVEVTIERTVLDAVDRVIVRDDGTGITPETCAITFDKIGGSWKKTTRFSEHRHRPLHGRAGQGRLRGFALGSAIRWTTIADSISGRLRTTVTADRSSRNDFEISDPRPDPGATGTVFEAWGRQSVVLNRLLSVKAVAQLTTEFAPYLSMFPEVDIHFDGSALDPGKAIQFEKSFDFDFSYGDETHQATLRVIEWDMRVDRELHLCDANGVVVDIADLRIQAPGFDFTAYVMWEQMAGHAGEFLLGEASDGPVAILLSRSREILREHFKIRTVERRADIIQKWKTEELYPYHGEPATETEQLERDTFDIVATTVQRHMPRPAKHLKATLALLRESVKHQPESVNRILDEVFRLSAEDRTELERLLDRTSLVGIIKASSSVAARLDFLAALAHMVFDPETRKVVRERTQLHKILENETWIFGEQYSLLVSDRSLNTVLDRHLHILGRENRDPEPVLRADGTVGIVDLMLSRARKFHDRRQHLVVELKAPKVNAGDDELRQIKSYAKAVAMDPQFADVGVEWDFWLVATGIGGMVDLEVEQRDKPHGCVWDFTRGAMTIRVWVKRWSEIIEECKGRLTYFQEHFDHDPSVEQAIEYLRANHPHVLPAALAVPSQTRESGPTGAAIPDHT
ncbi:ATP-binding protein [Streptacidiphilus cavernicola]|uniref:ATP-binding protein n=1 Tax=Streptacidiphilus cavernicola TaxID=3342716 RepID=A0ABV6W5N5_9ACTN